MKENNVECAYCGVGFYRKPSKLRDGQMFCCLEHLNLFQKKDIENVECSKCGKEIPLTCRRRRNSKTGLYFCGQDCRNVYVAQNLRWNGDETPNSHRSRMEFLKNSADNKCCACGLVEDCRLLDIHHIDNNHKNNAWNNLSLLCIRCHAKHHRIEPIVCKPVFSDNESMEEAYLATFNKKQTERELLKSKKVVSIKVEKNLTDHIERECVCGKVFITAKNKQKYCSPECSQLASRKAERPSKEELEALLKDNSWCAVGKMYDVSDNAVRKWAKGYGLPTKKEKVSKAT